MFAVPRQAGRPIGLLRTGAGLIFRFGAYEVDLVQQELRHAGASVPVEPQVFDVLAYLVRHRDRIVSKNELFDTVWQGRLVSDAALNSRISAARRAIGDSGNEQTLIRTLHKRGFRFVGEVEEAVAAPEARRAVRAPPDDAPELVPARCRPSRSRCRTSPRSPSCRFRT